MSISEMVRRGEGVKSAQKREPLLDGSAGNGRRRVVLAQLAAELRAREKPGYAHAVELVESMGPDSAVEAWEALYFELYRLGEAAISEAVAAETRQARTEAWQAMKGDADVISQVAPMGEQYISSHASSVNRLRQKLSAMLVCSGQFRLGSEMEEYVVNMARFGSLADDWMIKVFVEELYLERGLYEGVIGICERILGFEGHDRHRMMASTLVEDVLNALVGHLERCGEGGYVEMMAASGMPMSPECANKEYVEGLKKKCLELLEARAESLGLGILPDKKENSLQRRASDYALRISARRKIRSAGEIAGYIRERYPESHAFLGLGDGRVARRIAEKQVPLAENISTQMEVDDIAKIRNVETRAGNALEALEPMLRFKKGNSVDIKPKTLKKWKSGMLGDQLWECLFEMEVFLRLVGAGASVRADVKIPKAGGGNAEVDLEADGCLVEIYSPRDTEIRVVAHATHVESPGMAMVDYVTRKPQMRHVGGRPTAVVVCCPAGEFANIEVVRARMEGRLATATQPGAVFYVKDGSDPTVAECLVNGNAAAAVPEATIRTMMDALSLRAPQAWGRGMRRPVRK